MSQNDAVLLIEARSCGRPINPYGLEIIQSILGLENIPARIFNPFFFSDIKNETLRVIEELNPAIIGIGIRNIDDFLILWDSQKKDINSSNRFF